MKDVNTVLKRKLYELLQPVVGVPCFSKYMPSSVTENEYVLITTINSNDTSTMHSADTDTTVQISIYTRDSQANPGEASSTIAGIVYDTIYPTPQSKIDLEPDFHNSVLTLVSDNEPDAILTNNEVFINRFLIFRLRILHR